MEEKIKCPACNAEVSDGNFCNLCGAKIKEICDCWVLGKPYNCRSKICPGVRLHLLIKKRESF